MDFVLYFIAPCTFYCTTLHPLLCTVLHCTLYCVLYYIVLFCTLDLTQSPHPALLIPNPFFIFAYSFKERIEIFCYANSSLASNPSFDAIVTLESNKDNGVATGAGGGEGGGGVGGGGPYGGERGGGSEDGGGGDEGGVGGVEEEEVGGRTKTYTW